MEDRKNIDKRFAGIDTELLKDQLGHFIACGIPRQHKDGVFFYYGILQKLTDKSLVLKEDNGEIHIINLSHIVEIRLNIKNKRKNGGGKR